MEETAGPIDGQAGAKAGAAAAVTTFGLNLHQPGNRARPLDEVRGHFPPTRQIPSCPRPVKMRTAAQPSAEIDSAGRL